MILMRNWNENLLTRLTDINVVTSCLLYRMLRSWFGIVSPTSGCLAIYRAAVLYDNLPDYLTSGTAGDDRRLSFYALLRGQVVGVSEAVVSTQLPSTVRGMFRQRTRWSKSAWLGVPFVLTNLRLPVVFFYMFPLVFASLWPLTIAVLVTLSVRYGNPVLVYGVAFWLACSVTQTAIYALYRPGLTPLQRLGQWGLSVVYPLLGYLLLRPATYWALTKLRDPSWRTREAPADQIASFTGVLASHSSSPRASSMQRRLTPNASEPLGVSSSSVSRLDCSRSSTGEAPVRSSSVSLARRPRS
jgi:cellulose synthase/poly-beta-1,6-N-acetylglucosamine synthase-like glycosyltransferase